MDEKNVDVAKESSTSEINEQAITTDEHEKQLDEEEVNDENIISSKRGDDTTDQPTKELQDPAKGN